MSSRFSNIFGSAAVIAVAVVVTFVLVGIGADLEAASSALRERESTLRLYTELSARLEALVPPNSAPVLAESPLVDAVTVFDKFQYDKPTDAFKWSSLAALVRFARHLRCQRYDCLVILHHLTTRWGTLKYAALAVISGAKVRVGLDNGRGSLLTHRVPDDGFGARHEVEYWLDVVGAIGAVTEDTGGGLRAVRFGLPLGQDHQLGHRFSLWGPSRHLPSRAVPVPVPVPVPERPRE